MEGNENNESSVYHASWEENVAILLGGGLCFKNKTVCWLDKKYAFAMLVLL